MSKLKDIAKTFEDAYGKHKVQIPGKGVKNNYDIISTGSIRIDDVIKNGGFVQGRVHEIYGKESSGKTTLAIETIVQAQKKNLICSFIDMEHASDKEYMQNLGVDMSKLLLSKPDDGEEALDIVYGLIKTGDIDLIVIDSISALVPRAVKEKSLAKKTMGLQARLMSQALQKIPPLAEKNNVLVLCINQIRKKINKGFGNPETTSGGSALRFYATTRLRLERGKIYSDNIIEMRVKNIKNKVGAPFAKCKTWIMFGYGILTELEVLEDALMCGVIQKSGSWYKDSSGEMSIAQGKANMIETLISNPGYVQELIELINNAKSKSE